MAPGPPHTGGVQIVPHLFILGQFTVLSRHQDVRQGFCFDCCERSRLGTDTTHPATRAFSMLTTLLGSPRKPKAMVADIPPANPQRIHLQYAAFLVHRRLRHISHERSPISHPMAAIHE
jgi:hypothetical protein